MPLRVVKGDITRLGHKLDVIVNGTNPRLQPGGGVSRAIHNAAGPELAEACAEYGFCGLGDVKVTPGFNLDCRYVFHTVGPRWNGGSDGESEQLALCYRNNLALAERVGAESVAFPVISSGAYGFPGKLAVRVAMAAILDYLADCEIDMDVYLVLSERIMLSDEEVIDDIHKYFILMRKESQFAPPEMMDHGLEKAEQQPLAAPKVVPAASLDEALRRMKEADRFPEIFNKKLEEKGMASKAGKKKFYGRSNVSKSVIYNIKKKEGYIPQKRNVIAMAIAMRLSYEEMVEFLGCAGYALTEWDPFDVIVKYFVERGDYDIARINFALLDEGLPMIGG